MDTGTAQWFWQAIFIEIHFSFVLGDENKKKKKKKK